jgi:uncharacterized membrane protein YcaP (DUF421 family)
MVAFRVPRGSPSTIFARLRTMREMMIVFSLSEGWNEVFYPARSLLEMFVRGTAMYLVLFAMLRFVLKREAGGLSISDLLLVVLLADAAQNGMAGEYRSITEGIILVSTIIFWNFAIDWLEYHSPVMRRLLRPSPLMLIKDGRVLRRHLRQELVTMDELMSKLREAGITSPSEVAESYIEPDGNISVKKRSRSFAPGRAAVVAASTRPFCRPPVPLKNGWRTLPSAYFARYSQTA